MLKTARYPSSRNFEKTKYTLFSLNDGKYSHFLSYNIHTILQHIVFALTGIMAYTIPDVPAEIRTQIARERLLAKEARYEHGINKSRDEDEYDQLLSAIRESRDTSRLSDVIRRSSWGRRLSKHSQDEVPESDLAKRKEALNTSTVWEVP